jgi:dolichol-phosphate mannosyltransferase
MPTVSIVIPCFCNAAQLAATVRGIEAATARLRSQGMAFHLLLVDDASTDATWQVICRLKGESALSITGLRLGSNVGAYAALLPGLALAEGDAVIVMAADGDDPPALVPALVERWQQGDPLVQAARQGSSGAVLNRGFAALFYALMRIAGARHLPVHGSDFVLADRRVLEKAWNEGFRPGNTLIQLFQHADRAVELPYVKGARPGGGWSMVKKSRLFIDSLRAQLGLAWLLRVPVPVQTV